MKATSDLWTPAVGTIGFDTSAALSSEQGTELAGLGYQFAIRAVGLSADPPPSWALGASEANALREAGLGIGIYQTFRNSGITADQGTADGNAAAAQAGNVGYPAGAVLFCDFEGSYDVTSSVLIDYFNNWWTAVSGAGYLPGIYVGPQSILTGQELYSDLKFQHYWMSAANVPAIPTRGYQMYQLLPYLSSMRSGFPVAGTLIDVDITASDSEGGMPVFWAPAQGLAGVREKSR